MTNDRDEDLARALEIALTERNHYQARVGELQTRCTSQLEELRGMRGTGSTKLTKDVREFMTAFGQYIGPVPSVPTDEVLRLRMLLTLEETFETLDACLAHEHNRKELQNMHSTMRFIIQTSRLGVRLAELVDGLGDLDYVNEGFRLALGVDGAPIANEIHRANMSKADWHVKQADARKLGSGEKAGKPPGWMPPDIHGALIAQGWKP